MPDLSPPNIERFRVHAHHTDLNGAVHHARFLEMFDAARIETFRRLGYPYERVQGEGWSPVVRRLSCEYVTAARMDELLTVTVTIARVTGASMTIAYQCSMEDRLVALAEVTFAFVDASGRPIRLPSTLRRTVEEHRALLTPT